ncbi:proteolipid protein DM beta-like isoform X2 [Antedon mediterranea]|uniref:proteolipid protein DM beta-like isoform X2 n=1 Tax=Antedon mediterranea TaxID=105859 RepID=UPI003AF83EBC
MRGCSSIRFARCVRRIPFVSVFAFLLYVAGLVIFVKSLLNVLDDFEVMFNGTIASEDIQTAIDSVNDVIIYVTAGMSAFGLILIIVSILETGPTRNRTCRGKLSRYCGVGTTGFLAFITFVLCVAWTVISVLFCFPTTMVIMLNGFCNNVETFQNSCLDLTSYGFSQEESNATRVICGPQLEDFCMRADEVFDSTALSIASCVGITISLVIFLIALAANYAYVRTYGKLQGIRKTGNTNENHGTYTNEDLFMNPETRTTDL